MIKKFRRAAERLLRARHVHIVSHIDADGITSGSIASIFLDRNGVEYGIEFVKKLDEKTIRRLREEEHELIWFTDLGSGYADRLADMPTIITDHHEPASIPPIRKKGGQTALNVFSDFIHLNAHLMGLDGAREISGAGMTYLLAVSHDRRNTDLAGLAVVGALGDLQDSNDERRLRGMNAEIVKDGIERGVLSAINDIRLYGRENRDIVRFLQYASDPKIPGITGKEREVISFLKGLGIKMMDGEHWRRWCDLTFHEKKEITKAIRTILLQSGAEKEAESLTGEVYVLNNEEIGSNLHDAKEFATLMNSCGKYGKAEIGFHVCRGDRGKYLDEALNLLKSHKGNIVGALRVIKEKGIVQQGSIQYFHGGNEVPEGIVGTLAGMLLNSGSVGSNIPIVGFAETEDGKIKVSTRGNRALIRRGLTFRRLSRRRAVWSEEPGAGTISRPVPL